MLPKTDAVNYAAAHDNTTLLPNGKIRFDQTGMEFPSTVTSSILAAYANGKAFRRAVARSANEAYDFSVHEPYIVPHRNLDGRHFLYCTLTKATLPRDRHIVQSHVSAKRFRRRLAETEEAKKKQRALSEKRRERKQRAKASRNSQGEKKTQPTTEESQEEAEHRMDEDNDILDGIISDEDTVDGNDDAKEPPEAEGLVKGREVKTGAGDQTCDAMEEDLIEEKDVFWTRSRKGAFPCEEDDDGDDEEWGEPARKELSRRRAKTKVTESAQQDIEVGSGVPFDSEKETTVTGKRNRVNVQVSKKNRRARQRRKSTQ